MRTSGGDRGDTLRAAGRLRALGSRRQWLVWPVLMLGLMLITGCGTDNATPAGASSMPTATSAPAAPTAANTQPASGGPTAGTLASAGKTVFAKNCAVCHGDQGQGVTAPTVIGANASLAQYGDGQGLYDFVSQNMPQDRPGALSPDEYLQVLSFLLVENRFVPSDAPLGRETLKTIKLPR